MKSVAQEIRDIANKLAKINEGEFDDYDLGNVGSELDQDDDGDGKGFDQDNMVEQLAKIEASEGNDIINPQRTVTTDDGREHMVLPAQATTLGVIARSDKVKPAIRAQFQKDIQTSEGLEYFLSDPQGHHFVKSQQIIQRFQEKYLKV